MHRRPRLTRRDRAQLATLTAKANLVAARLAALGEEGVAIAERLSRSPSPLDRLIAAQTRTLLASPPVPAA